MAGKNEIIISRIINAPKSLVFKAWTEPARIKKWWGPKGFTAPVIKVNLRKGGKYLYAMRDPKGKLYWNGGMYKKIDAPDELVATDYFSNKKGEKLTAADYGLGNFPKESTVTVKFEEAKGKTKLSIIYKPKTASMKAAMLKTGMKQGWNQSLDKLAASLR